MPLSLKRVSARCSASRTPSTPPICAQHQGRTTQSQAARSGWWPGSDSLDWPNTMSTHRSLHEFPGSGLAWTRRPWTPEFVFILHTRRQQLNFLLRFCGGELRASAARRKLKRP